MFALTSWNPSADLARLQEDMDDLLSPFAGLLNPSSIAPPVDVHDDAEAVHVRMEIPGVKVEDVKIHVENNVLTISGERKSEKEEARKGYRRAECRYGSFTRSFELPRNVDAERVSADMSDGVLSVKIAKRAEEKAKRTEVKIGR